MSKFKVIPYKPDHFDLLEVRVHEQESLRAIKNGKEILNAKLQNNCCFTMMYDGRMLGVMGWFDYWPGFCEILIVPSPYLAEYGKVAAKHIKQYFNQFEKINNYKRIQVTAVKDDLHHNWLSWMGFLVEGTLKNYGPNGEDFMMWARCADGN